MKNKIIITTLLAASLSIVSCRKDYLVSEPTETLANPPAQARLNGLYLGMINTRTGGTTGHDDFGQKGYDIISDMLSSDMALSASNYGWYRNLVNYAVTQDFTQNLNYIPWRYYYRLIYATNEIIASLGGNTATVTSTEAKYAMGQAKALRAYCYYNLLQFYTPEYLPNELGIPMPLEISLVAKPKSKQSDIYMQISKDLEESILLLNGFSRANKGMINQNVARSILAYVYGAMGENQKSYNHAKTVMNSSVMTSNIEAVRMKHNGGTQETGGGFNELVTQSWLWGYDITTLNDLNLVSWFGQVDIFTYSYAWAGDPKSIDAGLYSKIKSYDIRKNQFVSVTETATGYDVKPADQSGDYTYVPANKFFHPDRKIGGQRVLTTDYIFMRADEMYLLTAEMAARTGNDMEAKTILKNFMSKRIEDPASIVLENVRIDALSNADLISDIYLNTRIELWGEGRSYWAMKRNKATINRGSNHLFFVGVDTNYNDTRLYLKIPQQEVNNNPFF